MASFKGKDTSGQWWEITFNTDGTLQITSTDAVGSDVPIYTGPSVNNNTYTWQDAIDLAKTMAKGVPVTSISPIVCDMVSSTIWKAYPWKDTLYPLDSIPLVDGQQDYESLTGGIYRITQLKVVRTDVSPVDHRDLNVSKNLVVDLKPRSPYDIRTASWQAGGNFFRLESAVSIGTGSTWELQGEYQPMLTKVTSLAQNLWLKDINIEVAAKGVLYWIYRFSDDPRAGEAQKMKDGKAVYTGQLGAFMDAIDEMAQGEDFGNIDGYFPDESFGQDGRRTGWRPFGW